MDSIKGFKLVTRHKNINGKFLKQKIDEFILDRLERLTIMGSNSEHARFNVVHLMKDFLQKCVEAGEIEGFQIICDTRNNNEEFMNKDGFVAATIKYKQVHCMNRTELHYELYKE